MTDPHFCLMHARMQLCGSDSFLNPMDMPTSNALLQEELQHSCMRTRSAFTALAHVPCPVHDGARPPLETAPATMQQKCKRGRTPKPGSFRPNHYMLCQTVEARFCSAHTNEVAGYKRPVGISHRRHSFPALRSKWGSVYREKNSKNV